MSIVKRNAIATFGALLIMAGTAHAQGTSPTTVQVTIAAEASLSITSAATLTTSGTSFANPFTGTTSFTYKIRTKQSTGTGSITLQVTSDFSPTLGPSVLSPPTGSDKLSYTCALLAPGTPCASSTNSSTAATTNVGTFGADAKSAAGTGSVAWSLTNDPLYAVGTYNATVTFTISAT